MVDGYYTLVLKIKGEVPPEKEGWQVRKGHCLKMIDSLPTTLPEGAFLTLSVYESGGGWTNTGRCTIVCATNGDPLHPYWEGSYANDVHAKFSVRKCVVIHVDRHWKDYSVLIEKIVVTRDNLSVIERTLWEYGGNHPIESLPKYLSKYKKALEAAVEKSQCFHCRHSHFSM